MPNEGVYTRADGDLNDRLFSKLHSRKCADGSIYDSYTCIRSFGTQILRPVGSPDTAIAALSLCTGSGTSGSGRGAFLCRLQTPAPRLEDSYSRFIGVVRNRRVPVHFAITNLLGSNEETELCVNVVCKFATGLVMRALTAETVRAGQTLVVDAATRNKQRPLLLDTLRDVYIDVFVRVSNAVDRVRFAECMWTPDTVFVRRVAALSIRDDGVRRESSPPVIKLSGADVGTASWRVPRLALKKQTKRNGSDTIVGECICIELCERVGIETQCVSPIGSDVRRSRRMLRDIVEDRSFVHIDTSMFVQRRMDVCTRCNSFSPNMMALCCGHVFLCIFCCVDYGNDGKKHTCAVCNAGVLALMVAPRDRH